MEEMRSISSNEKAYVTFVNMTYRDVDIFWVDFKGALQHYKTLPPAAKFPVTTFKSHPWIFKDRQTGQRMHVNHKPYFTAEVPFIRNGSRIQPQRVPVRIHFPLRSLRINALWRIIELVDSIDAIRQLEIPNSLKVDLAVLYNQYDLHRQENVTMSEEGNL